MEMEGVKPMKKKRKSPRIGKRKRKSTRPFAPEFKLKVVRLFLEEGYPRSLIAQEFNIAESSIGRWARQYKEFGEQGLQPKSRTAPRTGLSENVKERIVDLKRSNPSYGTRRISDILKRFFLIRTSPTTVHKTLSNEGLITKPQKKPRKNPAKPRFFERATPNQLWQTDIMTFRLAGKNAYLIGYLDDYSRYITACGFYRSQTAEHVLEAYRRAISEYGVPKEMLTDNGRQYTNWRGSTRFERELKKDRVKHIKSRPHHPMTLGKIERFWKTIQTEFFYRVQFTDYDEAVERCALWVKYYNYKRPHQGIGGLCPADRFFEIQHALKTTLEKGIEENALELALRGKPRDPFYMVGRMGDQSVVIRAEKGKVRMLVDGDQTSTEKELVYDARKDIEHENSQNISQKILRPATENHGRVIGMDRTADNDPNVPGDGHQFEPAQPVAESGYGGDAGSPEPEKAESAGSIELTIDTTDRKEPAGPDGKIAEAFESHRSQDVIAAEMTDEKIAHKKPSAGRGNHESPLRSDDSIGGRRPVGGISQDLLQMGTAGSICSSYRGERQQRRQTGKTCSGIGVGETAFRNPPGERAVASANGVKGSCIQNQHQVRDESDGKKMSGSCKQSSESKN